MHSIDKGSDAIYGKKSGDKEDKWSYQGRYFPQEQELFRGASHGTLARSGLGRFVKERMGRPSPPSKASTVNVFKMKIGERYFGPLKLVHKTLTLQYFRSHPTTGNSTSRSTGLGSFRNVSNRSHLSKSDWSWDFVGDDLGIVKNGAL